MKSNLISKVIGREVVSKIPEGCRTVEQIHAEDAPHLAIRTVREILNNGANKGILNKIKIHNGNREVYYYGEAENEKQKKPKKAS
jgi:hypothetical protein